MYVLDTNILIDFFKGNPQIEPFFADLDQVCISYVVAGELLQGVRHKQDLQMTQRFLNTISIDYGSPTISQLACELTAKHSLKDGIGFLDALIAATALELSAKLVTMNLKHFRCIKGLEIVAVA